MMKSSSYINGNYFVSLDSDGTKKYRALRIDDPVFKASFPDSIDLKITNRCSFGCPYCHENSTKDGKRFDINRTEKVLLELPSAAIEIAIGGGDVLECTDKEFGEFKEFLSWCETSNFKTRITINYKDIEKFGMDKIKQINFATEYIGLSIPPNIDLNELYRIDYDLASVVYHVIVGINPIEQIEEILQSSKNEFNLLVLGFKSWGRGKNYNIPNEVLENWKIGIKRILFDRRSNKRYYKNNVSFDNLAIEQLDIRGSLLENEWKTSYMGDDFTHSMYVDAVEEIYAPTSRDPFRVSWNDMSLLEFFRTYRKEDNG